MDRVIIRSRSRFVELPGVDRVEAARTLVWLKQGWQDLVQVWPYSLAFGVLFSGLGFMLVTWAWNRPYLAMALTSGFLLIAPLMAIFLYDASKQLAHGARHVSWRHFIASIHRNALSIGLFGVLLTFVLSAWERLSAILVGLLLSGNISSVEHFSRAVLSGEHQGFLLAYGVFGLLLAIGVFAISVVSLPMLMDRRVDIATAILTSLKVVKENVFPMLAWATLIVLLTLLGFATAFAAMIVIFPWLGHASWHAYGDLVEKH